MADCCRFYCTGIAYFNREIRNDHKLEKNENFSRKTYFFMYFILVEENMGENEWITL